jgi:hypothetical protein
MPLILGILSDFLKSTQPGIQAADARVKFLALGETLVFRKAEIIVRSFPRYRSGLTSFFLQDMDFYGENRTVAHEGTVGRKEKRWIDNSAKLLDHYCAWVSLFFILFFWLMRFSVILAEERAITDPVKQTESKKYYVNSRVRFPLFSSTERPLTCLASRSPAYTPRFPPSWSVHWPA